MSGFFWATCIGLWGLASIYIPSVTISYHRLPTIETGNKKLAWIDSDSTRYSVWRRRSWIFCNNYKIIWNIFRDLTVWSIPKISLLFAKQWVGQYRTLQNYKMSFTKQTSLPQLLREAERERERVVSRHTKGFLSCETLKHFCLEEDLKRNESSHENNQVNCCVLKFKWYKYQNISDIWISHKPTLLCPPGARGKQSVKCFPLTGSDLFSH